MNRFGAAVNIFTDLVAERDAARANADRLAEAARWFDRVRAWAETTEAVGSDQDLHEVAAAILMMLDALAAHDAEVAGR